VQYSSELLRDRACQNTRGELIQYTNSEIGGAAG
jgi:hypothetical protein